MGDKKGIRNFSVAIPNGRGKTTEKSQAYRSEDKIELDYKEIGLKDVGGFIWPRTETTGFFSLKTRECTDDKKKLLLLMKDFVAFSLFSPSGQQR
jgi:hypothetical protein